MIAFDTNLLVRFVTQDDPAQAARVESLMERTAKQQESIFICDVVLCELVWVLTDCYDQSPSQIAEVLDRMFRVPLFAFENKERVWSALSDFRSGKAGFADYLIGRTGQISGAAKTYTFDRGLKASPLFEVLA